MSIVRTGESAPYPRAPTVAEADAAAASTMRPTPAFARPEALARRQAASLAEGNDGLGTLGRLPGELRNQMRDLLPPRAVGNLATLSSRNALESHGQRTRHLEDRLGRDLESLTSRDHVLAFGELLMKLPTERRESHLRGLALRTLFERDESARRQVVATVRNAVEAEDATPQLKAAWSGLDPRSSPAAGGRAWALATAEERQAVVDANARRGLSRQATEVEIISALGMSRDLDGPSDVNISQLAARLGIETELGFLARTCAMYVKPSEPANMRETRARGFQ